MAEVNVKKVKTSEIELKERMVHVSRVTKVTKGGRAFTFSAIVVVGNENGVVGYGLGKAKEVQAAIQKGAEDAKKNLIKVPVINGTLPHEQYGKYCGAYVYIQPAQGIRPRSLSRPCGASHGPQPGSPRDLFRQVILHRPALRCQ